jgi:hypothetical protein
MPLGGVWTQGIQLEGSVSFTQLSFKVGLTLQEALNASKINWQQGQSIPGRPRFISQTQVDYDYHGFKVGTRYIYKSSDVLDLGGLWFQPPQHWMDSWIGYGARTWELRLIGVNLFPTYALPQNMTFQGSAAPNLIEPNIQQREIRLQCEILI